MARTTAHSRRRLALTLTLALALVACSSLWHNDHERELFHDVQTDAPSLIVSPALESLAVDACPICLTHRLLTQSWIQAAQEAVALTISAPNRIEPVVLPAVEHSDSPEARAPPLC